MRSLGIKSASLHTDGLCRGEFLRYPANWDPGGTRRIWELNAPACGLDGAPAALRKTLLRPLLRSDDSQARIG